MKMAAKGLSMLALALTAALAAPIVAQPKVLPVEVAVTGPTGEVIPGLGRDDFSIAVDGRPAAIAALAGPGEPLTVVLLLDVSASVLNYSDLGDEIERSFAKALRPTDRARVGGIGNRLKLSPRFTSDVRELVRDGRAAIDFPKRERFGPSPIWDALDEAIRVLAPEPGRRVVILVSDGRSTGNTVSAQAVVDRAVTAGIVVSGLSDARVQTISQGGDLVAKVRAGLMMQELARLSGGLCLPENPPEFGEMPAAGPLLTRLVNDARAMYTIGVPIEDAGKPVRTLSIQVKREGATVRSRPAVVVGARPSSAR